MTAPPGIFTEVSVAPSSQWCNEAAYHSELVGVTPYSSISIPRIHTAAVWTQRSKPSLLPMRSCGVSMPASRRTTMNPCRNMRDGNTGTPMKSLLFRDV